MRQLFRSAGLDLAPGLDVKQTTPEDLARSPLPHATWLMQRAVARRRVEVVKEKLRARRQSRPGKPALRAE